MRLGNHHEAEQAASFTGRQHTFVLSSLTATYGTDQTSTEGRPKPQAIATHTAPAPAAAGPAITCSEAAGAPGTAAGPGITRRTTPGPPNLSRHGRRRDHPTRAVGDACGADPRDAHRARHLVAAIRTNRPSVNSVPLPKADARQQPQRVESLPGT
jgi:hypothetical protein